MLLCLFWLHQRACWFLNRTFWFLNRLFLVSESTCFGFCIGMSLVSESHILVSESHILVSESCILVSESRFFWFLNRTFLVSEAGDDL